MATWKSLVRDEIETLVEESDGTFELHDVYDQALVRATDEFPENAHPRAKIRQVLQQLRDAGEVEFLGDGVYRLSSQQGKTGEETESGRGFGERTVIEQLDSEL